MIVKLLKRDGSEIVKDVAVTPNIQQALSAKQPRDHWSRELEGYVFTLEDYNMWMDFAKTYKLY